MEQINILASKLFSNLLKDAVAEDIFAQKTKIALEWYKSKILKLSGTIAADEIVTDETSRRELPNPGGLFMFHYRAKHRNKLPYYDEAPLVLVLDDGVKNGFLGLNFHYLAANHRAIFMNALYSYEDYDTNAKETIININYDTLKSTNALRFYKPCIKKYLYSHLTGTFMHRILPVEWEIALFLPTQKFVGAPYSKVLSESSKLIG